jgi:hypothetical protein
MGSGKAQAKPNLQLCVLTVAPLWRSVIRHALMVNLDYIVA